MRTMVVALVASLAAPAAVHAQPARAITVGIYAPSVEFGSASARLAYVQGLAKAIERATGVEVAAQSYANYAALEQDAVDFAVIEAQCHAVHARGRVLATAAIGGAGTRPWALYASGPDMQSLRGKKLAYVQTGCNDAGFIDHAMLDSEVDSAFFGQRVGKAELASAVAEVASYRTAQAVFAPTTAGKGLTKLFDTGAVPNPAFVAVSSRVSSGVVDQVASAVLAYTGAGAISGWVKPSRDAYSGLARRMKKTPKPAIFAAPGTVRIDASDVLVDPPSLQDPAFVDLHHLFVRPADRRMN